MAEQNHPLNIENSIESNIANNFEKRLQTLLDYFRDNCTPRFSADLAEYAQYLKTENLAENTILGYLSDIKQVIKIINAVCNGSDDKKIDISDILNLQKDEFKYVLSKMLEKNASTQERLIIAMRKWSLYKKTDTAFTNIQLPKKPELRYKIIEEKELIETIKNLKEESWKDYRNNAVIVLLYTCGLRINEALNLRWQDIYKSYCKVLGKGSKERYCPLLDIALDKLEKYKKALAKETTNNHAKSDYVFCNTKGRRLDASHFAKITHRIFKNSPHKLRHACATSLINNGCNLRTIQQLLGHANLETTTIYVHQSIKDLQKMHNDTFNK